MKIKQFTKNVLATLAEFNVHNRDKTLDMTQEQWAEEFAKWASEIGIEVQRVSDERVSDDWIRNPAKAIRNEIHDETQRNSGRRHLRLVG